jgi:hypothetical protein
MDRLEALAVLIGVDLSARQPLGQDLLGIGPLLLIAPARAPEQGDRKHGDQRPEAEHAQRHQQPGPSAHRIATHHLDRLLPLDR